MKKFLLLIIASFFLFFVVILFIDPIPDTVDNIEYLKYELGQILILTGFSFFIGALINLIYTKRKKILFKNTYYKVVWITMLGLFFLFALGSI